MSAARNAAVLLTPPGPGAIAVIQVRGPDAIGQAARVAQLRNGKPLADWPIEKLARADFVADGRRVDEGLVVVRRKSATGSVVELHCHGSMRVVQRLMTVLATDGGPSDALRPAQDAGWQDPKEEELAAALAKARTRRAVAFVLSQAAALSAHVADLAARSRQVGTASLIERLQMLLGTRRISAFVLDSVRLALVGPANAGKSTLANRLLGAERLVVSPEVGTTRDWTEEPAALAGIPVTVIDTAGHRATDHPVEREAIARGGARAADADVLLVVLDLSRPLDSQLQELDPAWGAAVRRVWVANKCDRPAAWDLSDLSSSADGAAVRISALTGEGLDGLERAILAAVGLADLAAVGPCLLTDRQAAAVQRCVRMLRDGQVEAAGELLAEWAAAGTVVSTQS